MSLAEDLWGAEREVGKFEEELCDLLDEIFGSEGWDDMRTDYYDSSIEVFGVDPNCVLAYAELNQLHDAGFRRAWTHTHLTETRQPGERSYSMAVRVKEPTQDG